MRPHFRVDVALSPTRVVERFRARDDLVFHRTSPESCLAERAYCLEPFEAWLASDGALCIARTKPTPGDRASPVAFVVPGTALVIGPFLFGSWGFILEGLVMAFYGCARLANFGLGINRPPDKALIDHAQTIETFVQRTLASDRRATYTDSPFRS